MIGSRWATLKRIEADSGARMTVDNNTASVAIVGPPDAVRFWTQCLRQGP